MDLSLWKEPLIKTFLFRITILSFRDAPNAVWLRRQPDVQSVHLPVHQLLLVDHLHRLLQGQVRRLPRPLPQHHGQQPQKWRRKDSSLSNLSPVSKILLLTQCGNGGCLIELAQQLAVIMIGESKRGTGGGVIKNIIGQSSYSPSSQKLRVSLTKAPSGSKFVNYF